MTNETLDMEADVIPALPDIAEAEHPAGIEMTEWTFSNDKSNMAIRQLFHGFYNGVFANKLGLMHALNTETENVETIIVGVENGPDGVKLFPLAKVLDGDELSIYKAPDGNGGFVQ
jgi:hypothetical protein